MDTALETLGFLSGKMRKWWFVAGAMIMGTGLGCCVRVSIGRW